MDADNFLHNGKSKPGSAGRTLSCTVYPVETIKQERQMLRRNPIPCIPNMDYALGIDLLGTNLDASPLWKMIYGITQQIHPDLHEQHFIAI
jgi:hypothetical protein